MGILTLLLIDFLGDAEELRESNQGHIVKGGIMVAKIYEIGDLRAREIKLAKLKEMLGELFHRAAIPYIDLPGEGLDHILPESFMRHIDDLTLGELDDLLNGHLKFFIPR
jgi:hypothetical protein